MCELHLTSINISDAPLAALAAYGLLRIVTEEEVFQDMGARWYLRWEKNQTDMDAHAVLIAEKFIDDCADELVHRLKAFIDHRAENPWEIFVPPSYKDEFETLIQNGMKKDTNKEAYDKLLERFNKNAVTLYPLLSLGRWVRQYKKNKDLFNFNQMLTYTASINPFNTYKKIIEYLKEKTDHDTAMIKASLVGEPWSFQDITSSFRLHKVIIQEDAYMSNEASKIDAPTEAVGEWLAFEALPYYASYLTRGRRNTTMPGLISYKGNLALRFPLWSASLSYASVRSLLHLITVKNISDEMKESMGIDGIIEVKQYKVGQGLNGVAMPVYSR
ncbi:hypothetical protein CULT_370045 [[Clostridium] ultunense Esp]|nr:hypothetical protein CULT_370045 [[Clostridium] ultunense Esp]